MSQFIDVFKIFDKFPDYAPKSLDELEAFEQKCIEEGKPDLAEYIFLWRTSLLYHIEAEWAVGDAATS